MDADDLISPERLSRQLVAISQDDSLDLVSTGLYSISPSMEPVGRRGQDHGSFSVHDLLLGHKRIVHASVLARREWMRRNPYDESLEGSEDAELWVRTAALGDFRARSIKVPLYIYRESQNVIESKLLQGYRNERRILAPYLNGSVASILYRSRSLSKSMVVRFLAKSHQLHRLQRWRNDANIPAGEALRLRALLKAITETPVAGLDAYRKPESA